MKKFDSGSVAKNVNKEVENQKRGKVKENLKKN